jgi:hypothetical protein
MGNTSSDSLNHSFKRLRLSQTEQLPIISPSSVSPKRKVPFTIATRLTGPCDNDTANDSSDQLPILLCHNSMSSSSTSNSRWQTSKPIMNKLSHRFFI